MEYGLIGERLGHSFSKIIHNKINSYNYELKELLPAELEPFMLARDFKGINVTIPYKKDVISYLSHIDASGGKNRSGEYRCQPRRRAIRLQYRYFRVGNADKACSCPIRESGSFGA